MKLEPQRPKRRILVTAAIAASLALTAGSLWFNWGRRNPAGSQALLALNAEHVGRDLLISWDRAAAARLRARAANVTISDGESHQQIALDSTELESGKILYAPRSGDIAIRLDVHAPDRTLSASIRVLGAPAAPATPEANPQEPEPASHAVAEAPGPAEAASPAATQQQPPRPPAVTAFEEAARENARRKPALMARAEFRPPAAGESKATQAPYEEPPQLSAQPQIAHQPAIQALSPGPAVPPAATAAPAASMVIEVKPPNPVHRAQPSLPAQARPLLSLLRDPVVVEVEVDVDEAGAVTKARLQRVSAEPAATRNGLQHQLVLASLVAARNWDFTPAARNGRPIPARALVRFRFAPAVER